MSDSWEIPEIPPGPVEVGIVITCYNLSEHIARAVDSVLSQTVTPVDVVVVDDASEDDSPNVIAKYAGRIKSIRLSSNRGVSIARNTGAESVDGSWLMFLDGDDYLDNDALNVLASAAVGGGYGVVLGGVRELDTSTGKYSRRDSPDCAGPPPAASIRGFWRSAISTPGAAIVHRSVHEATGGFPGGYRMREDRHYWLKCGVTTSFHYCDRPVITKVKRPNSKGCRQGPAILSGMRVQLDFLDWCRVRDIDTRFIRASMTDIIDNTLKRAMAAGDVTILREVMDYCEARRISSWRMQRYRLYDRLRRLSARRGDSAFKNGWKPERRE